LLVSPDNLAAITGMRLSQDIACKSLGWIVSPEPLSKTNAELPMIEGKIKNKNEKEV
jgi:hypothetical protein